MTPPLDIDSIPNELVNEIRAIILQKIEEDPDKFHESDVNRFEKTNEMVYRFLIDYFEDTNAKEIPSDTTEKVSKNILATLFWRKDFGTNTSQDSDFPREFYTNHLFQLGQLADGTPLLILNSRKLIRLRQWSNIYLRFIVHETEKIANKALSAPDFFHKPRIQCIADTTEIGLAQCDISFIFSIIPIFLNHYPQSFQTIWLYELPYFAKYFKGLVMKTLPTRITKRIMFTDRKSLAKDMGPENVPAIFYGGKSKHPLKDLVSSEASTLKDVARRNKIPESEVDKMMALIV